MRDVRDILRNHFGHRFLDPQQFWYYAQNLQIVDSPFVSTSLLEFLERERLLVPACRVEFPAEIVRVWYSNEHPDWADPSLPTEIDENRVEAATDLYRAIRRWAAPPRPDRGIQYHPLDLVDGQQSEFVHLETASRPFRPWDSFEVHAGTADGNAMKSPTVDTYYRYWQVFRFAEVLSMAAPVLVNFAADDAFRLLCEHRLAEISPENVHHLSCSLLGWHALREFSQYEPGFETVAFFRAYRDRAFLEAAKDQPGATIRLTGQKLQEFRAMELALAHHAAWRWNQSAETLLEFVKWQCARWDEWAKAGRLRLCEDYERNVSDTIYLYRLISGAEYEDVVNAVGRVTGHFRNTLDVMFPDWFQEQRELADRSLKQWIGPTMSGFNAVGHGFTNAELDEFLAWIFTQGFLQVPLFFARLVEVKKTDERVAPTVLAKEVEGLASTIEHLMNAIGALAPPPPAVPTAWPATATLRPKMQWLWSDLPVVSQSLNTQGPGALGTLTNTGPGFTVRKAQIATVLAGDPHQGIVQHLLLTLLVRNQGAHLSLSGFDREETYELIEVLLRTILLSWKHARARGIV